MSWSSRILRRSLCAVVGASVVALGLPLAAASPAGAAAPTDVFLSEYIEGSSNNKALEIYNGTGASVDLAAGTYEVQIYFNGSATAGLTIPLTGTVADGDVYVVAQASASAPILAHADQTNTSGWYNGDDAVVLARAGVAVDSLGQVAVDPGTEWGTGLVSTADNTLRRNATECAGDTSPGDGFDPAGHWDGFATDTFDGLGSHTTDCGGDPVDQPPVTTCPATLTTTEGTATSSAVSAIDDLDAIASIAITSEPVDGITLTPGATSTATLDVADTVAVGSYDVVVEFTTDGDPPQSSSCTVNVEVASHEVTLISDVQGAGSESGMVGAVVTVEGIVTSLFTSNDGPDGFFLQEEDADVDGNAATSEGIFVFCRGACPAGLAVGDQVRVRGPVSEFFGMTQVSSNAAGAGAEIVSSANPLPAAADVDLPAGGSTEVGSTFEAQEGMVVRFTDTLAVSEYFELARYGQLVLTADARPYQFTHTSAPSVDGYAAHAAGLDARRIILDDDNNTQNDAVTGPQSNEPYPWPAGGLAVDNRVRGGDTISGLTGVLHWSFAGQPGTDAWRVRPIQGLDYEFTPANPAPAAPDAVGGDLRVASYNVLNYFATVDTDGSNDVGICGPSGTLDCRGADSEAERVRQLDKIAAGLAALDPHVAGLIEIQNDAGQATEQIVEALNARTAPGTYAAIETGFIGTDAIKVALIYQPAAVVPVGDFAVLDSSIDPRFIDTRNRPVLVQTFEQVSSGGRFTIAVNHLKSKGSACVGDPDVLDGQGNCNLTRTAAAEALADYLATDPTGSGDPDVLIVGDLNSYRLEDPITKLRDAGYTDLQERFETADAYSYVFDGQLGYLDTALANPALNGQVTGTTTWHINADEVPLFDYNDAVRDAGEASFERESNARTLYAPDPLRSSDHDPVLVGLFLATPERALAALQGDLAAMTIQHGVENALTSQLATVAAALASGDDTGACTALAGFTELVTSQRGKKITTADAGVLLTGAAEVAGLVPC